MRTQSALNFYGIDEGKRQAHWAMVRMMGVVAVSAIVVANVAGRVAMHKVTG